jgi:hypothetical protein
MKRIGILCFAVLLFLVTFGSIRKLYAQATAGYTKVASVPFATGTVNFTMATPLIAGATYNVEITGQNAVGESGPSAIQVVTEPTIGSHTTGTITGVTQNASGGTPATINIYVQQVQIPNPLGVTSISFN